MTLRKVRIGLDGRALGNINRFRGIGFYTARLVEALVRRGEDYDFILFGYGDAPDDELLDKDILERLEWRRIPRLQGLSYLSLLSEHLLFARVVQRARVDLFHAIDHNMTPFLSGPSLVTVHDLIPLVLRGPYLGPTAWLWMQAHRWAAKRAKVVITVSQSTRRDVERIWGIPTERIQVVPEGVSPHYRPLCEEQDIEGIRERYGLRRPYFLYLGGFDPRKNIHNMLLGFKRFLISADGEFQFLLCGDKRGFEGYLEDEIEELGLEEEVILAGFIPVEDQQALYAGALALVCVSLYEGFGLPLLEAMACGTPVLASRVSSIPEVVGEAGLLVDPVDPESIAQGMKRLVLEHSLRKELVSAGLERSSLYTWDRVADSILEIYRRVIRGGEGDERLPD